MAIMTRALGRTGADVTINGRSQSTVRKALGKLRSEFPGCAFNGAVADLYASEGTDAIIAVAPECDILINNAAVNVIENVLTQPDEVYLELFELNFLAPVRLARHYMPGMLERNWGRMIFHSSEQALRPSPDMAAYAATKAALLTTSRSIAEYTRGTGVTVNSVIIGPTKSDVTSALHDEIAASTGRTATTSLGPPRAGRDYGHRLSLRRERFPIPIGWTRPRHERRDGRSPGSPIVTRGRLPESIGLQ